MHAMDVKRKEREREQKAEEFRIRNEQTLYE
jgi:hypothetical protein